MNQPTNPVLNAYFRTSIEIARGDGAYLYDTKGKQYLDFASGIAVTGLGHNHPHLNQALTNQLKDIWHCSNLFTIPEQQRLAERLTQHTFADKVFFCSSGVEAVETCIKIIRKFQHEQGHDDKDRIITLEGGFHGRSIATISAGGNEIARDGFGPLLGGFDQVPANDIQKLKSKITSQTAGILIEPIQAEGGVIPLDPIYLKQVEELAHRYHLVFCLDEVQCGYGRTGSLFAYQDLGLEPDLLASAKGIGNGFPLAACLMTEQISQCITPGTHGSTYGGNPLAMAIGNAVLDIILKPEILSNIKIVSEYLQKQLEKLQHTYPNFITDVRGKGLLQGIEVTMPATDILLACLEQGLAVTKAGNNKVIRLVPPLIINQQHVDEAIEKLSATFTAIHNKRLTA